MQSATTRIAYLAKYTHQYESLFYAGDEGIHPAKDGPSKAHAYKQEKRAKGDRSKGERERERESTQHVPLDGETHR